MRLLFYHLCVLSVGCLITSIAAGQTTAPADPWPELKGGAESLRDALGNLDAEVMDEDAWREFIKEEGEAALPFICALRINRPHDDQAQIGFQLLLDELDLDRSFAAIQALKPEHYAQLLTLIDLLPMKGGDLYFNMRLVKLLRAMKEYLRAFEFGRRGWLRWPNQAFLSHSALAIVEGELQADVWQLAGARLVSLPDAGARARELEFYAELSNRMKMPGVMMSLIALAGLQAADFMSLMRLTDRLYALSMRDQVKLVIGDTTEPALRYQFIVTGQGREPTTEEWAELLKQADDSISALRLALVLRERQSPRVMEVWERLLSFEDLDPRFAANAHLQLGDAAKKDGRFAEAADHLEEMVKKLASTADALSGDELKRVEDHIERLRLSAEAGPGDCETLLINARQEMAEGNGEQAIQMLERAIELQPDNARSWIMLFEVTKRLNHFDRLPGIGARLAELTVPKDEPALLSEAALQLSDSGYHAKALKLLRQAMQADPDNPTHLVIMANLQERAGDPVQAMTFLSQAPANDFRYWRLKGMLHAQQGAYVEAAEAFERVMEYGHVDDYVQLWHFLMRKLHAEDPSPGMRQYMQSRGDAMEEWIAVIYAYVKGDITRPELIAAAHAAPTENQVKGRLAEAHFYMGLDELAAGNVDAARQDFQATLEQNILVYIEHAWAKAMLRLLDAP